MDLLGRKAVEGRFYVFQSRMLTNGSTSSQPCELQPPPRSRHGQTELRNVLAGQTIRHTEVLGWEVSLGGQYRRMRTVTCQPGMYHLLFELHTDPAHCKITIDSRVAASFARFSISIPPSSRASEYLQVDIRLRTLARTKLIQLATTVWM
jgi:hypothetical protein